jgi:1-acyl-sn-glycerol-3-phosphate acyltransferase
MTRLRSLLFVAWFYLISAPLAVLYSATLIMPRRAIMYAMGFWAVMVEFGLRWIAGVKIEVRGRQYMPRGAALIAAKHQGMLDTIAPFVFLHDPCIVLKKELLKIPFYGWHASKARMIPVDREAGAKALKDLVAAAQDRLGEERQIIIYPEGTRKAPGAEPDYKPGIAALYRELGLPCTPMATNSGVHWPAHGFLRNPGTVVFEFLPPIPAGLKRADFMRELESRIETASDALLEAGI